MAQTRPCDVSPTGDQDKYTLALVKQSGEWWGLDVPLFQIHPSTMNPPAPIQRVAQNSFHMGRGADRFQPNAYNFQDAYNGWSTTPGKFHATMLQRWSKGLRNADFNMPDSRQVQWRALIGNTKYQSVSFQASASYTAAKIILLLRRQVPAGTMGSPGTFTVELCANSGGNPGAVVGSGSATLSSSQLTDVTSQYVVFNISSALVAGTTYHVKVYGPSGDRNQACWEIATDPGVAGKRSANGSSWTAVTWSPYYRITDAETARQFKPFMLDGALYCVSIYDNGSTASRLYINGVRGRAVGAQTSTTLKDTGFGSSGVSWTVNQYAGCYIRIVRGTGRGQVRQIASNTGDTFTVTEAWDVTPVASSSEFVVYGCDWFTEIAGTGLGVVTGPPVIQNGIVYFPQGDSTNIRKMRIDYADADDHAFASESASKNNKAYFLETAFDTSVGEPIVWRANQAAAAGTPAGKAISVGYASSAPLGVAVPFATDLTFAPQLPVLCGDNTSLITNIYEHENNLYVTKEDGLYLVQNNRAVRVRLGIETAPDIDNGRAICTGGDKNLYMSFRNDVYMIAGNGAYPTGLNTNMPSNRKGVVYSLIAAEGWLFAAVNKGNTGISSVMKFSLDTKSWSEQLRGFSSGRRIRNLQWQPCPETRPRLWIDQQGEMMCQEFPIDGTRPYDDKALKFQHETNLILPTVDLGSTDPKYFSVLTITTQGLAEEIDLERGHIAVVECQTDNDVGTNKWEHVDYVRTSPTGSVKIERGNKRMIRIRLRLISNEPTDPVILETVSLTLFTRNRLAEEFSIQFPILSDDEEQNSIDLLMALREMSRTAQPLILKSRFTLFHDRFVTISDMPKYQLSELEPEERELEAQVWVKLTEVI